MTIEEVLSRPTPDIPTAENLVENARIEIIQFFGREFPISQPPQLLIDTLMLMQNQDIRHFEPLYLPSATLGEKDEYPGWKIKMGQVKAGDQICPVSRELPGIWVVFDTTPRQPYSEIKSLAWNNDPLSDILSNARNSGKIYIESLIDPPLPPTSRFGLSTAEQDEIIFPELAKQLNLGEQLASKTVTIRRPTLAEFNYMGNLRHPELGGVNTLEFMQDTFGIDGFTFAVTGGSSRSGGLAHAQYIVNRYQTDARGDALGFRAVIAFQ